MRLCYFLLLAWLGRKSGRKEEGSILMLAILAYFPKKENKKNEIISVSKPSNFVDRIGKTWMAQYVFCLKLYFKLLFELHVVVLA